MLDPVERQYAYLRIFECDRLALVLFVADAVEAENFAGHVIAGDLLPTIFGEQQGLERTGADRIERG